MKSEMVTLRKNRRGRNRFVSGTPITHRQVNLGPLVYADRQLWGLRIRTIWLFGHKIKSWKVKTDA